MVFLGVSFPYKHFLQKSFESYSQESHKVQLGFEMHCIGEKTSVIHISCSSIPLPCKTSLVVGTKDDSDVASGVRYDVASFLSWSMYYTSYVYTRVTSLLEFSYSRNNITSTDGDRRVNCHYTLRSRSSLLHDYFEDAEALCPNVYYCNT